MRVALLLAFLCPQAAAADGICAPTPSATLIQVEMCWADHYAELFGVPLEFVQAIIEVESAWRPYAVSPKGAAGLMQLMPPTAAALGVTNRFRIDENIRAGVAYIAHLIRQFEGELRLVAAAYYAGETRIKKYGLEYANADVCRYVFQVGRFYRKRRMVARPLTRTQPKE